jgi:hypothetical protein
MRRSDGNTEKWTGCRMYIETSRTIIESVMFRLIRRSITMVGIGSTMTSSIPITPTGIIMWSQLKIFERFGSVDFSAILIDF